MKNVNLTMDGLKVTVPAGTTILAAAKTVGIQIPTLCHHPDLPPGASCRICLVEIAGQKRLEPACAYPVAEGMAVLTNSTPVRTARRVNLQLLLAQHDGDCLTCSQSGSCQLQDLAIRFGVRTVPFAKRGERQDEDLSSPSIQRDMGKCILCGRCRIVCISSADVLARVGRGYQTQIQPQFALPLAQSGCVACGQCTLVCPTGALKEREEMALAFELIQKAHTVVQVAPAVRVTIAEEFGLPPGSIATGQLVAALRRLGFKKVFDTNFTADLTILEEGTELLGRLKAGPLPMFTSCSPGWINFMEQYYPSLLGHLSTCKSPQGMFGALAKSYYADKCGLKSEEIKVVSIMPCTAKKMEAQRPQLATGQIPDVDLVLTTRELGKMLREAGIDLRSLPQDSFDAPFGLASGAGAIFGTTGGVMEAALRTVAAWLGEKGKLQWEELRGGEALRTATITLAGQKLRLAVVYGLGKARELLAQLLSGSLPYDFVEVMCCPGGCIGGGGQSLPTTWQEREKRAGALYEIDSQLPVHASHENPGIRELYQEYLGEIGWELAHSLLHTTYTPRPLPFNAQERNS